MPRPSGPTAGALSAPTFPLQFCRLRTVDSGIQSMKLGARTDRSFASLTSSLGSAQLPQAGSSTVALSSPLMPLGSFRLPQLGTSSFHQLLAPHEVRSGTVRWGTEVEKGTVSPARAPLPWALRSPFFLYRSISSGPGGGRRDREESKTPAGFPTQFRDPIPFSLAETSALLLTNGEQRPRAPGKESYLLLCTWVAPVSS